MEQIKNKNFYLIQYKLNITTLVIIKEDGG
jgi:hypothetical protein